LLVIINLLYSAQNWRRPPGRPHTTWMKTIQQDLKSNNLSQKDTTYVAQNRPLWRCPRLALRNPTGTCQKRNASTEADPIRTTKCGLPL